jgi:hypothetical protein
MTGNETAGTNALPTPLILYCPGCSKEIKIVTHFQSNHVVCACRRVLSLSSDGLKYVTKFEDFEIESSIPIGSKGTIEEVLYQVVGFLHCKERSFPYHWKEYILFNPLYGYCTLSEFEGHWNIIKPTRSFPRIKGYNPSFNFEEKEFKIFNKYQAEVVIGIGEFSTNISKRERAMVYEFIAPPEILIREISDDEENWYHGKYIDANTIWRAFNLDTSPPVKQGVGATQPLKFSDNFPLLKKVTLLAVFLITCLQILNYYTSDSVVVFNQAYRAGQSNEVRPIVTPSFDLSGGISNLEFTLSANVQNEWFETQIALINDLTGEEYNFENGVEYYSGYSGGESWSEGSNSSSKVLSSIPDGKYHMNIFPYKPYTTGEIYFTLSVKRDVLMWSNFFLFLFLILIYPAIQWIRVASFESRRWMNSDYAPY